MAINYGILSHIEYHEDYILNGQFSTIFIFSDETNNRRCIYQILENEANQDVVEKWICYYISAGQSIGIKIHFNYHTIQRALKMMENTQVVDPNIATKEKVSEWQKRWKFNRYSSSFSEECSNLEEKTTAKEKNKNM